MLRDRNAALFVPLARAAALAAFTAAANVVGLAAGSGGGRIRDLRVLRLLRRLADQLDWNMLAGAPSWVHAGRSTNNIADCAILFASAAAIAFLVLAPLALLFRFAGRRASLALLVMAALTLSAQWRWSAAVLIAGGALAFAIAAKLGDRPTLRLGLAACTLIVGAFLIAPFALHGDEVRREVAARGTPNIVLISIDSLRADHLHSYGYPRATSPNLDALAAEGTSFETVISPTSWTLPAHMTLLTSLPPEKHGVITNQFRLSSSVETLPQRLQRSGYATAGFVSATYLDGLFGFSRGFDTYDDYSLLRVAGDKSRRAVTSRMVADRAIDWLQHRSSSPQPFFLFLHFFDVHYDYNPPAPYATMFDGGYRGRATGDLAYVKTSVPPRDVDHVVALYDGEIAWVDANIGRVLATLRALGFEDNTIVAVTADHGEEFLDHGQSGHFKTLYDEVLRVPLIVRYPGHVAAGRRVAGQVRLMDVGPTLFALAGVRMARSRERTAAHNLTCFVKPASLPKRQPSFPAFGDLKGEIASLRTGDAKLIRNLRTKQEEFYDLAHDPGERHNKEAETTADADALHGRAAALRTMLEQWRSSTVLATDEEVTLDDEDKEGLKSLGYMQ